MIDQTKKMLLNAILFAFGFGFDFGASTAVQVRTARDFLARDKPPNLIFIFYINLFENLMNSSNTENILSVDISSLDVRQEKEIKSCPCLLTFPCPSPFPTTFPPSPLTSHSIPSSFIPLIPPSPHPHSSLSTFIPLPPAPVPSRPIASLHPPSSFEVDELSQKPEGQVDVAVTLHLTSASFDEKTRILSGMVWLNMIWKDERCLCV